MRPLEMTSSDLEELPSLSLGNECGRVSRGYSNCWRYYSDWLKLRRVTGEAHNMTKNTLSILIVIFFIHLQQTETSDRKLFISQHSLLHTTPLVQLLLRIDTSWLLSPILLFRTLFSASAIILCSVYLDDHLSFLGLPGDGRLPAT